MRVVKEQSMSGAPGNNKSVPIDRSMLAEISGGDQSIERKLLTVFRQVNEVDAAALKEALEKQDVVSITRAAHRISGAGKMAGAMALAGICERIEHAGRANDWDTIAASRDALYRELERVNTYLGTIQLTSGPGP